MRPSCHWSRCRSRARCVLLHSRPKVGRVQEARGCATPTFRRAQTRWTNSSRAIALAASGSVADVPEGRCAVEMCVAFVEGNQQRTIRSRSRFGRRLKVMRAGRERQKSTICGYSSWPAGKELCFEGLHAGAQKKKRVLPRAAPIAPVSSEFAEPRASSSASA